MVNHQLCTEEQEARAIVRKLRVNWEHAAADESERVLVDAGDVSIVALNAADDVVSHRDVCTAVDKAPHVPFASTSSVSALNGKV